MLLRGLLGLPLYNTSALKPPFLPHMPAGLRGVTPLRLVVRQVYGTKIIDFMARGLYNGKSIGGEFMKNYIAYLACAR